MSIKEQKLALYIEWLERSDRASLIIRGLSEKQISEELTRIRTEYYSKIKEVPKKYTLGKLQALMQAW